MVIVLRQTQVTTQASAGAGKPPGPCFKPRATWICLFENVIYEIKMTKQSDRMLLPHVITDAVMVTTGL